MPLLPGHLRRDRDVISGTCADCTLTVVTMSQRLFSIPLENYQCPGSPSAASKEGAISGVIKGLSPFPQNVFNVSNSMFGKQDAQLSHNED